MLFIKHCLLILPLFVAICEVGLPELTYGVYLVLSLKPGATHISFVCSAPEGLCYSHMGFAVVLRIDCMWTVDLSDFYHIFPLIIEGNSKNIYLYIY